MDKFNQKLKDYLTVYKTPIAPNSLDPTVFYFPETGEPPRLLPGINAQITNDLQALASTDPTRIQSCVIVGDAVKPGTNNRTSDIKVLVVLNKALMNIDMDGIMAEEILKMCNALSQRQAVGTTRKINYVPTVRDLELNDYEGVYDIPNNTWIKTPSGLK
tara:strand:+ start:2742 stop:3221 length:480 start_codon:yes stop_codon:yes gene_type:complete